MEEKEKFILHEIDDININYYTGNTYKVKGETYPIVTNDLKKAKIYTSNGKAQRGLQSLSDKCIHSTFEILPLGHIAIKENTATAVGARENVSISSHELSLGEKINFVNGLAKKDPTLNFLINLENGGLGHITITEALDALASGTSIELPGRKRSLILEEDNKSL